MTVLSGHQLVTKISTGTAYTAQTLRIPYVSVHAREARGDEPSKVTLGAVRDPPSTPPPRRHWDIH